MKSHHLVRTTLSVCILGLVTDAVAAAAGPCVFCSRGEISFPDKPVSIPGYEFLESCGNIQALAPSFLTDDDPQCELLQSISTYCGCPPPLDSCSLCPDGSAVQDPEKEVPWLQDRFEGIVPSCELTEAYAASLSQDDDACKFLRGISHFCGCPPRQDHCTFCKGEPLQSEYYDKELPFLSQQGITGTCEMFYELQYQLPQDHEICDKEIHTTFHCGCNDEVLGYYGTSNTKQQAVLAGIGRAIGVLSLLGSCCVLWDIFSSAKKRKSVYHQLMMLIASFDVVTACVFIVGPSAVEEISPFTQLPWGIYGAKGNEATCRVQGYFFQLGFTSVFLNVSLTVYYLLVIVYGWRESRLRKHRLQLFGPPLLVGLTLSFAVIPFIDIGWTFCQFDTYPESDFLWSLLLFGVIPIISSTTAIMCILLLIYCKVRNQRRKALRWGNRNGSASLSRSPSGDSSTSAPAVISITRERRRQGPSTKDRLEREVMWQSISYASAFCVTWPILCVAEFNGNNFDYPYGFWVVVAIAAPLQGFSNALCYFRPVKYGAKDNRRRDSVGSRLSEDRVASDASVGRGMTFLRSHLFGSAQTTQTSRPGSMQEPSEVSGISGNSTSRADEEFLSDPSVALANLGSPLEPVDERFTSRASIIEETSEELQRRLSTTLSLELEAIPEGLREDGSTIGPGSKASLGLFESGSFGAATGGGSRELSLSSSDGCQTGESAAQESVEETVTDCCDERNSSPPLTKRPVYPEGS